MTDWADVHREQAQHERSLRDAEAGAARHLSTLDAGRGTATSGAELGHGHVTVTVDVGADRLPERVTVATVDGWYRRNYGLDGDGRRLTPGQVVGLAVCQASLAALHGSTGGRPGTGSRPRPVTPRRRQALNPDAMAAEFADVTTDVLAVLRAGRSDSLVGRGDTGVVRFAVSRGGLEDCYVDDGWVAGPDGNGRPGSEIGPVITQAMVQARAVQAGLSHIDPLHGHEDLRRRMDSLLADALGYLEHLASTRYLAGRGDSTAT